MYMMALVSRLIGRHRLIIPSFYPYLQKYLKYSNKEIGKIFAYLAEATHVTVPQTELDPLVKYIITHFANESCTDMRISMGLNCITQMCARKPLLLEEEDLKFLCELSTFKEKNVNRAVKCLINLYRDLNIEMLPKRYRGRRDVETDQEKLSKRNWIHGEADLKKRVDGAELLGEDVDGKTVETERFLTQEDLKKIKKLKKKALYKRELKKFSDLTTGQKAIAKPGFDLLANRQNLKNITLGLQNNEIGLDDVQPLQDTQQEETYEDWEEDLDNFVDGESDSDDSSEDLTRPYERNHGFLSADDMMRFIPSKQKRLEMAKLERKLRVRENKGIGQKIKKHGEKTNSRKAKNKPFMMVADKLKNQAVDLFEKIRKTKNQIGKVSKRLSGKLESKKNAKRGRGRK